MFNIENSIQVVPAWGKKIRGEVAGIACMGDSGPLIIALQEKVCLVVSKAGKIQKTLAFNSGLVCVKKNQPASLFAVSDEKDNIYGFTPEGSNKWQKHFGGFTTFALGAEGALIVDNPPYGLACLYPRNGAEERDIKCLFSPSSLALIEIGSLKIAVAGELGELGVIDTSGSRLWDFNMGIQTGPVTFDQKSDILAVPAYDEGVYVFDSSGDEKGAFMLNDPVSEAIVTHFPEGSPLIATVSGDRTISLMDIEGRVAWQKQMSFPIIALSVAESASWLALVLSNGELQTYDIKTNKMDTSVIGLTDITIGEDEDSEPAEETTPVTMTGESKTSQLPAARVYSDFPIIGGLLPKGKQRFKVSPAGRRIAISLPGGEAVVLGSDGKLLVETRINAPARILESDVEDFFAVWSPERLVIINNNNNKTRKLNFDVKMKSMACAADLDTIAGINREDELVVMDLAEKELFREKIFPSPKRVFVSPGGEIILVEDEHLRFHYFSRSGELKRKQKFKGELPFEFLIMKEKKCVFASRQGPIILQTVDGELISAVKINGGISDLYSLGDVFAVGEKSGGASILNWEGKAVWRFDSPSGTSLVRLRPGKEEPVIFQVHRKELLALTGKGRQLSATWHFRCDDDIEFFDADRSGKTLALAAGGRIYCVGAPDVPE